VQPVSLISQLKDWFRPSARNGEPTEMLSTPNRFSKWDVVLSQRDGQYQVVNTSHEVVATCRELDDAESIMAQHNKMVRDREDWFGA